MTPFYSAEKRVLTKKIITKTKKKDRFVFDGFLDLSEKQ